MKSAYVVELTPRAPRVVWGALHVVVEPERVRSVLENFVRGQGGRAAFQVIVSGATLGVWVVQRGLLREFIDLHPFIRADLGNGARTLSELWGDERVLRDWGAAAMDDVDPWLEHLTLEVFWDPIAELLTPLQAPLLAPGDCLPFEYGAHAAHALGTRLRQANPMLLGSHDARQAGR